MNKRVKLIIELILWGVTLFVLESTLPLIFGVVDLPIDYAKFLAKLVPIPFALFLAKRWNIELAIHQKNEQNNKLGIVSLTTILYFVVIFPISFPIDFVKDLFDGKMQKLNFHQTTWLIDSGIWWFLQSVVIAPIIEEILYRGIIQIRLVRDFSPKISILIASFIFAISHYNPTRLIRTFLCGLLFGTIYNKYGSLILSIAAHSTINLLAFFTYREKVMGTDAIAINTILYTTCLFALVLINKRWKLI